MTAADYAEEVKTQMREAWLPLIYCKRILKMRTRAYHFGDLKPNSRIEIQHSLLGVELKVARRRLLCPDLPTARYLSVFARACCKDVALPYDITLVSSLADELESSWHRMLLLVLQIAGDRSDAFRARIRGLLIAKLRTEVAELGSGPTSPQFKQNTKQRRNNSKN